MGIKDLWSILQPYCERKPLYELQGKIVAIDLAGWVCESLCVVDYEVQPRFYLRNLFFRTCFLVLNGVTPVFVLEGDAPPLKYGVICKRNEIQFRGARPKKDAATSQSNEVSKKPPQKGRSRFNYVLKQCEDLLLSMGLQCVQGPGEAEAFCAYMNQDSMVDGVISQDSDCFAYGATKVYRNFSVSMQGQTSAQGGAVDVYDMVRVCENMDFGQNKMIAMALLCGCDYCPDGVPGVGRDAVTKFFDSYSNSEVIDRIKSWRENDHKYTALELKVDDKSICVNCGHHGRVQNHTKNGCAQCHQHRGCDANLWKNQRLSIKSELTLRQKALKISDFPSQAIIDEFLLRPVNLPKLDLNWRQPNLIKFLKFMSKLLQWEEIYCWQKFLPLLTRWQLFHFSNSINDNDCTAKQQMKEILTPKFIKKKRAPKGVASYEIIWQDEHNCFNGLLPEEQMTTFLEQNSNNSDLLWSTIEPEDLVQKAYPKLVENFLISKIKPKKTTGVKKKEKVIENDDGTTTNKPKKVTKSKRVKNNENQPPKIPGNALIDQFFKKTKTVRKPTVNDQSPKIKTTLSPINLSNFSIDFEDAGEFDEHDLSNAIQNIIARPPNATEILGRKLRFDEYVDIPIQSSNSVNTSLDEFDMMIMRTDKKPSSELQDANNASTPIHKTKPNRHNKRKSVKSNFKLSCDDLSIVSSEINNLSCNFFDDITKPNAEVFEKSIDFHNMPDEFDVAATNTNNLTTNGNDTFDLANYVPIGAKLKKKFNRIPTY